MSAILFLLFVCQLTEDSEWAIRFDTMSAYLISPNPTASDVAATNLESKQDVKQDSGFAAAGPATRNTMAIRPRAASTAMLTGLAVKRIITVTAAMNLGEVSKDDSTCA